MDGLHDRLMREGWYSKWSANPSSGLAHWAAFLLIVFVAYSGLTGSINSTYNLANVVSSENQQALGKPDFAPNELLIKVTAKAASSVREGSAKASGIGALQRIDQTLPIRGFSQVAKKNGKANTSEPLFRWYKVAFAGPIAVLPPGIQKAGEKHALPDKMLEVMSEIKSDPKVADVEPNYILTAAAVPNDPYYSSTGTWGQSYDDMYGLKKISAAGAWDQQTDSSNIIVADVDTGADYNHPDLAANIWTNPGEIPGNGIDDDHNGYIDDVHGYDFINNDPDPMDDNGHGTHTAGTIAAVGNNGTGVVGVNWKAKLMILKFLGSQGEGSTFDGIRAIQYAADNGARVTSNSWGCLCGGDPAMDDGMKYAHDKGVVNAVAAGNADADALDFSPANGDNVITVAASDWNDQRASFSNWGEKIDVAAPGVNILSTKASNQSMCGASNTIGNIYCFVSGTSMATPHVAGLATLLLAKNPNLTPEEVRQIIRGSADDTGLAGPDAYFGYGRINASSTVANASSHPLTPYITSPTSRSDACGTTQAITGSVKGPNFASYKVEYTAGRIPSGGWTLISSSTAQPSTDSTLASIDASKLNNGQYMFRVTATDTSGKSYVYQVDDINVDNFSAALTGPSRFAGKGSVAVSGSAAANCAGLTFSNYKLEYGAGANPTSWTLIKSSTQPVSNGTLGTWDTTQLQNLALYTLRLTATATNGAAAIVTSQVTIDDGIASGFPETLPLPAQQYTIGDIDGDGKKEMIFVNNYNGISTIYAYRYDGSIQPGFPITSLFPAGRVTLMDVNGDGVQDIVVPGVGDAYFGSIKLMAYGGNGAPLSGWTAPTVTLPTLNGYYEPTVSAAIFNADINGDSVKDAVLLVSSSISCIDTTSGWCTAGPSVATLFLEAYNKNGASLPGFPRQNNTTPGFNGWQYSLSMQDMNGDGHYEIAASTFDLATPGKVYLFDDHLNLLPGWPFILPDAPDTGIVRGFGGDISSADFFGDGKRELFIGTSMGCGAGAGPFQNVCFSPYHPMTFGLNMDGTLVAGFPKSTDVDGNSYGGQNVHADVNGDGADDIISQGNNQTFNIITKNGVTSYTNNPPINSPAALADVDGDGKIDLIGDARSNGNYIAINNTSGNIWQRLVDLLSDPLVADLDGDGHLEVMSLNTPNIPGGGPDWNTNQIYVWHVNFPNQARFDWPTYGQNIMRDFNLRTSSSTSTPPVVQPPVPAHIVLSPTSFTFTAAQGTAPSAQTLAISNTGSTTLNWNASTDQSWCHVSQSIGTASLSALTVDDLSVTSATSISVSVDAMTNAGTYNCTVTISDPSADNSPQTASVTYTVSPVAQPDTQAPTVSIYAPTNGSVVKQNANLAIKANATDNTSVVKVEFYVNGNLQCSDNSTPYTCGYKVPKGSGKSYALQAKAYDQAGNVGTSATVTVRAK